MSNVKFLLIAVFLLLNPKSALADLNIEDSDITINVNGISKCFFGDLDALLLDLSNGHNSLSLQLTVEALPLSKNRTYYGKPMSFTNISQNGLIGSYKLTIPKKDRSNVFMIFLCGVSNSNMMQEPCSRQGAIDINDSLIKYRVSPNTFPPSTQTPSNPINLPLDKATVFPRTYFSQVLFRTATFFTIQKSTLDETNFKDLLAPLGTSNKEILELHKDYLKFSKTLNSLPIKVLDKTITIELPYFDTTRCAGL